MENLAWLDTGIANRELGSRLSDEDRDAALALASKLVHDEDNLPSDAADPQFLCALAETYLLGLHAAFNSPLALVFPKEALSPFITLLPIILLASYVQGYRAGLENQIPPIFKDAFGEEK